MKPPQWLKAKVMMMGVQNVCVHSVNAGRSGSLARVARIEGKFVCLVC